MLTINKKPNHKSTWVIRKERLKGYGYSSYSEYISSVQWKRIRELAYDAGKYSKCCICGSKRQIALHHTNYSRLGELTLINLWGVCERHHRAIHWYAKKRNVSVEEASNYIRYGQEVLSRDCINYAKDPIRELPKKPSVIMSRWEQYKASQV